MACCTLFWVRSSSCRTAPQLRWSAASVIALAWGTIELPTPMPFARLTTRCPISFTLGASSAWTAIKPSAMTVPRSNAIRGRSVKLVPLFVRTNKGTNFTERPRIALLLGTVIADGFIAVQAEDAPSVKEIGQRVVSLAKGIGVGNSIVPHAKAITEAADHRNWGAVRQELDRTQNSVQQAMNEVHDEKLSQLVSLGGLLRGTQVLTSVVNRHFSTDGAELLHQPDLLDYFQRKLGNMAEFKVPLIGE